MEGTRDVLEANAHETERRGIFKKLIAPSPLNIVD
jgi:hypothetical protein